VTHIRKIFFKRGEYWLVHDLLVGPDDETCTASVQYQYGAPGATVEEAGAVVASHNEDANLAILPVSDRPCTIRLHEGEEKPPKGWIAWSLHKALKTPATMAVVEQKASLPLRIDALLFPYPGKERPNVRIRRLPEDSPEMSALEIVGPGWRDVYHCSHGAESAPHIQWVRYDADGKELARAEHGAPVADAKELPVQALRHALQVTAPGAGRLVLDYGPPMGGCLFHRETAVKAGENTVRLPSIPTGNPYAYAVRFVAEADGSVAENRGVCVPEQPLGFDFEDGEVGEWSNAKVAKDEKGSFLRAERPAGTGAVYLSINHPLPELSAAGSSFSFRYRTPMPEGGDWCYTKLSLTDTEGRHWAAYVARSLTPKWRRITLQRTDLRRDDGNKGAAPMPENAVLKQLSVTLRKGKTKGPVPAVLDLDNVSWVGAK
jgi:hypothetical protein